MNTSRGGDGDGIAYGIDSWDILVTLDLNRDGVVDESDLAVLLGRLGLVD